ncbi:alpha/beta fold hydrolase [Nitrospirillum iridis]|uniref:Pimeloyl-ACP methyl ester carboxylesterase n=1 Tax=Nitrospirillum iridis TaxID=765888 RepID=A0A7X0B1A9_9PROT|nr:alpha/beta fold hydrolase [Nitrospirillum iridis]MBB6253913.1 pimeloyl-ACP methyl ester carboxylesterase [Nitrospirillum iridis]
MGATLGGVSFPNAGLITVANAVDIAPQYFHGRDGQRLAFRELGQGRPLVLIHGYFSTATINWLKYGHAARIAERGFRVIMPDLRAHGDSAKPHEVSAYPADVLAEDGLALVDHLGLTDYDLGGYSLGGRTTMRMLARGATPGRAICAGMGLAGLVHTAGRGEHFRRILTNLGTFQRGTPEWMAEAFLKTVGGDPVALLNVLETFVDTPLEVLRGLTLPVLVTSGAQDRDNGSAQELADALPQARHVEIPGDHMSAVTKPELGLAIADFLAG